MQLTTPKPTLLQNGILVDGTGFITACFMNSGNLARNIMPKRAKVFAPWNVFSALLLLPEQQSTMVKRVLEGFGMDVHSASGISEADQIVRSTRLDLAICDFDVPRAGELTLLQPSTRWRGVTVGLMPTARLDD